MDYKCYDCKAIFALDEGILFVKEEMFYCMGCYDDEDENYAEFNQSEDYKFELNHQLNKTLWKL